MRPARTLVQTRAELSKFLSIGSGAEERPESPLHLMARVSIDCWCFRNPSRCVGSKYEFANDLRRKECPSRIQL